MGSGFLEKFVENYNRDKEDFNRKFEQINKKLQSIDDKFENFDEGMRRIDKRLTGIEEMQSFAFSQFGGFREKLENVKIYLSSIEDKLNEYKALYMQGETKINGELYMLKIKLCKVKPIISWEGDQLLADKYRELEESFEELFSVPKF